MSKMSLNASRAHILKYQAAKAAVNIVKSSKSESHLIEMISGFLEVNQEMQEMLEKVLAEYKEMLGMSQEVKGIEQLLAKARGEHV